MNENENRENGDRTENQSEDRSGNQSGSPPAPESPDPAALREQVIDVLKTCYDPEIPVNIYELGLIYDVLVSPDPAILTAPPASQIPAAGTSEGDAPGGTSDANSSSNTIVTNDSNDTSAAPGQYVKVTMTLTSPACPVAGSLPPEVEYRIRALPGVADARVDVVWDPPWTPEMMTDAARLQLNMF